MINENALLCQGGDAFFAAKVLGIKGKQEPEKANDLPCPLLVLGRGRYFQGGIISSAQLA